MTERCPNPPARLPGPRGGEVLPFQDPLTRIYARGGSHPLLWTQARHFGPLRSGRFDPHKPPPQEQERGVIYACAAGNDGVSGLETAVAEVFQDARFIERFDRERWAVIWQPQRELRLLDLDSRWTLRAGGNRALTAGSREISRRWARSIYEQLSELDGLTWRSSVLGRGRSVALWERALDALPQRPQFNRALSDPALYGRLAQIAERIGYEIL